MAKLFKGEVSNKETLALNRRLINVCLKTDRKIPLAKSLCGPLGEWDWTGTAVQIFCNECCLYYFLKSFFKYHDFKSEMCLKENDIRSKSSMPTLSNYGFLKGILKAEEAELRDYV